MTEAFFKRDRIPRKDMDFTAIPVAVTTVSKSELEPYRNGRRVGCYLLGATIGEGSFAKVKVAIHMITGEKVAVKVIDKKKACEDKYISKHLRREAYILQLVRHPNIIQLLDVLETESFYYLVMEYCSGGELLDFICTKKRLDDQTARKLVYQLVSAVDVMHHNCVVHRDLKIENFLLTEDNDLKIVDFGLSNTLSSKCIEEFRRTGVFPQLLRTHCGSPAYAAPELLAQKQYGPQVDAWSIGVNMYAMLTGFLPYMMEPFNVMEMYEKMMQRNMTPIPAFVSKDCRDLLVRLLEPIPEWRATLKQVLQHRWFHGEIPRKLSLGDLSYQRMEMYMDILVYMEKKLHFKQEDVINGVVSNRATHATAVYHLLVRRLDRYLTKNKDIVRMLPTIKVLMKPSSKSSCELKKPISVCTPVKIKRIMYGQPHNTSKSHHYLPVSVHSDNNTCALTPNKADPVKARTKHAGKENKTCTPNDDAKTVVRKRHRRQHSSCLEESEEVKECVRKSLVSDSFDILNAKAKLESTVKTHNSDVFKDSLLSNITSFIDGVDLEKKCEETDKPVKASGNSSWKLTKIVKQPPLKAEHSNHSINYNNVRPASSLDRTGYTAEVDTTTRSNTIPRNNSVSATQYESPVVCTEKPRKYYFSTHCTHKRPKTPETLQNFSTVIRESGSNVGAKLVESSARKREEFAIERHHNYNMQRLKSDDEEKTSCRENDVDENNNTSDIESQEQMSPKIKKISSSKKTLELKVKKFTQYKTDGKDCAQLPARHKSFQLKPLEFNLNFRNKKKSYSNKKESCSLVDILVDQNKTADENTETLETTPLTNGVNERIEMTKDMSGKRFTSTFKILGLGGKKSNSLDLSGDSNHKPLVISSNCRTSIKITSRSKSIADDKSDIYPVDKIRESKKKTHSHDSGFFGTSTEDGMNTVGNAKELVSCEKVVSKIQTKEKVVHRPHVTTTPKVNRKIVTGSVSTTNHRRANSLDRPYTQERVGFIPKHPDAVQQHANTKIMTSAQRPKHQALQFVRNNLNYASMPGHIRHRTQSANHQKHNYQTSTVVAPTVHRSPGHVTPTSPRCWSPIDGAFNVNRQFTLAHALEKAAMKERGSQSASGYY